MKHTNYNMFNKVPVGCSFWPVLRNMIFDQSDGSTERSHSETGIGSDVRYKGQDMEESQARNETMIDVCPRTPDEDTACPQGSTQG